MEAKMAKAIAIVGTLDSKGDQIEYFDKIIKQNGRETIIIDVGVLGEPVVAPDITKHQVAQAAGVTIDQVIELAKETFKKGDSGPSAAMDKMTEGACKILENLQSEERLSGIVCAGGTLGTSLALNIMSALPLLIPKLILSTVANSPGINPDLVSNNVMMMPWIGGLWGINKVAKMVLNQAAAYIIGASKIYEQEGMKDPKEKSVAVTSLGMTACKYLYHLRPSLRERGYDTAVFHSAGAGRIFERLVASGEFDFVLDLFAGGELLNEIAGSLLSPGPRRLEAAVKQGVPQIVSLGLTEIFLWGAYKPVPEKFSDRPTMRHNSILWMIPTKLEERLAMVRLLAEKLNLATAPTAVIVPLKASLGTTQIGLEDKEGMMAIYQELKSRLEPKIKYIEVDASTDDKAFSDEVIRLMDEMLVSLSIF
jgi:uncharacterized protein (UPF0261 family)